MPSYKIFFYQLNLNEAYYSQHIITGLSELGHEVYYNQNFQSYSHKDLIQQCRQFRPDFVLLYGFTFLHLISSYFEPIFTEEMDIPLVVIFTDNPLRYLFYLEPFKSKKIFFFCCDSELVALMRQEGFAKTYHLPLFFSPPPSKGESIQL